MHADEEDRHLERELAQRAHAARARVPRAAQARPAADAGDQGRPGQVPRPRARRSGLPRRPPLGGPLGGRGDRRADGDVELDRRRAPGSTGEPDADEARWLEATAGALRVVSTYVPNGREVDIDRSTRASCASSTPRPSASRALVRRRAGARGRLQRLPGRHRRLRPGGVRRRHARHAGRARALPGAAGRRHGRRLPRAAPRRARLHLVGLPRRPLPQEAGTADRRDPGLAAGRRPAAASAASTATSARARSPPITPRCSPSSTEVKHAAPRARSRARRATRCRA